MNTPFALKTLVGAVLLSAMTAGSATAVTVHAGAPGTSWTANYAAPIEGGGGTLSATAIWSYTGYGESTDGKQSLWTFGVKVFNTTLASALGTNRLTSLGFATDPDATFTSVSDEDPNLNWSGSDSNFPGFNKAVELCGTTTGGCGSAGGGKTTEEPGIAEGKDSWFTFTLATILSPRLNITDFAVRFASVGKGDAGSQTFGGGVSEVPLPAALPLFGTVLAGMGGLGWLRRRKQALATPSAA